MKMNNIEFEKKLYKLFDEERLCADVWAAESHDKYFTVEISWGDWKHEHLRCKWIVTEFLMKHGIELDHIETHVTEEDGSDCYSAIHRFYIN